MTRTMPRPPAAEEEVRLDRLSGSLGFLLRMAQVQVFEFFFDDLAPFGLRPGEFSVLYVIHLNPDIRQGLLAQRLRIKRAHMTKMIRGFEERGLIARRIPDDDRRAVELRLTDEGTAFVTDHAEAFFSHDARRPTPLSAEEQSQLFTLLQKYVGLTPEAKP